MLLEWKYNRDMPKTLKTFPPEFLTKVKQIISKAKVTLGIDIGDGFGNKVKSIDACITANEIRLNGLEKEAYETFLLTPNFAEKFAKRASTLTVDTNNLPYTIIVLAILLEYTKYEYLKIYHNPYENTEFMEKARVLLDEGE